MSDEIFDRTYQSGRAGLNDGLDLLFGRMARSVTGAFNTLNRIQFAAPWSRSGRMAGCE